MHIPGKVGAILTKVRGCEEEEYGWYVGERRALGGNTWYLTPFSVLTLSLDPLFRHLFMYARITLRKFTGKSLEDRYACFL